MPRDIQYYDTRDIFRGLWGTVFKGKKVKEREFLDVVLNINQKIADAILEGKEIILPLGVGRIFPVKMDTIVKKGDRYINRKTINWPETKRYGFYVRNDVDYRFKLVYNKKGIYFRNKRYINFSPIRSLREEFLKRAENKDFECYKSGTIWRRDILT